MEVTLTLTERGADHHEEVRALLLEALQESGLGDIQIEEVTIRSDEDAIAIKCLGSPTIRVNGILPDHSNKVGTLTSVMIHNASRITQTAVNELRSLDEQLK